MSESPFPAWAAVGREVALDNRVYGSIPRLVKVERHTRTRVVVEGGRQFKASPFEGQLDEVSASSSATISDPDSPENRVKFAKADELRAWNVAKVAVDTYGADRGSRELRSAMIAALDAHAAALAVVREKQAAAKTARRAR